MAKLMRIIRKLFLDRNKVTLRPDGLWESRNDWYGTAVYRCETKEEALQELKKTIALEKAYTELKK